MTHASWAIIANPVAGRGRARKSAPYLAKRLEAAGHTVAVSWTASNGDAETLAREASNQGVSRVVACGGDGTIHQVINGLMTAQPPGGKATIMGIVPLGRCNDLASTLGIPTNSAKAAEVLLAGNHRLIDLGRVGHRYYSTVATLGFDTEVSKYVANGKHPFFLKGTLAYLYGTLIQLVRYRDVDVLLSWDFGRYEGPIFLAATGNTPNYGGRMKITPSALIDDGLLDLCLVRSAPRWDVLRMIPKVFSGTHGKHPAVSMNPIKRLEIESDITLSIWADGEPVAETPTVIEVVPGALPTLVPAPMASD